MRDGPGGRGAVPQGVSAAPRRAVCLAVGGESSGRTDGEVVGLCGSGSLGEEECEGLCIERILFVIEVAEENVNTCAGCGIFVIRSQSQDVSGAWCLLECRSWVIKSL